MRGRIDPDVELDDARREVLARHARAIADRHDADSPLTAAHAFRPPAAMTPAQGLGLLAAMALVLLSGFAGGFLIDLAGIRTASIVMLAVAAGAAAGLGSMAIGRGTAVSTAERVVLPGTLVLAALAESAALMALVPALVHGAVARVLFRSLEEETTLIEKGARISHPLAPSFIGPYCRKLTAVWAGLFAASAIVTATLAATHAGDAHRAWTGWAFWCVLGGFSLLEFFWRKAWFRYYGSGPLDRLLAKLLPPGNTARGRRSAEYVRRMREELARLAEAERSERRSASSLPGQP